jgi:branched-chain amino acid transport system substrate-binding protein
MTGYYSTTDTLAAIPATERAQIPLLAPVAQGTALTTSGYQYVFCNAIQANKTGIVGIETLMAMAKQFGTPIHKIAVLGTDDPALLNDLNSTVAEANALGLQVVFYQTYPTGVKDVSNLVAELKAAQPDAVILLSFTAEAILAAQTLAEEKVDAITYFAPAGTGTMDPHFISTIGNESNYYIGGAGFMPDLNIPGLSDVVNRYETQYHEYMDEVAGQSYVSAWIIADVLELSAQLHPTDPLNGNSIRDAFLNVNITSGPATYNAAGHVQFNQDGENKYATLIYEQIQNGTQYTVWPLNLASKTAVWPLPKWESR